MRGKAVGFYVRSSLHSCETSMCIYFAVHLMHLSSHPFSQNCASSRPSSSVGSSRPGSSPVPVALDGHTVNTSHSSCSSTHSDNITQSFDKTSESLVYLLIQHQKKKHHCKGWLASKDDVHVYLGLCIYVCVFSNGSVFI